MQRSTKPLIDFYADQPGLLITVAADTRRRRFSYRRLEHPAAPGTEDASQVDGRRAGAAKQNTVYGWARNVSC